MSVVVQLLQQAAGGLPVAAVVAVYLRGIRADVEEVKQRLRRLEAAHIPEGPR